MRRIIIAAAMSLCMVSLVGAAGGACVQVLTRGRDVQVLAETVLRLRLDRSVTLQPER